MPYNRNFETGFFVGGEGMFLQYFDVVKPVYLYAVLSMMAKDTWYGLPNVISHMSIGSILEWYKNRRYVNPLQQLDWQQKIDPTDLHELLMRIIDTDSSICRLCPELSINRLLDVYHNQHMVFPFYIYTEEYHENVKRDIDIVFGSVKHTYLYGDLKDAISKCDQNFTYIFSDLEVLQDAAEILTGTYSHILLTDDYRYNYYGNPRQLKCDLRELMSDHPYIRTATTSVWYNMDLRAAFNNIIIEGGGQIQ